MRLSFSLSVLKIIMGRRSKKKDATVKVIGKPIQSFIGNTYYSKPVVQTKDKNNVSHENAQKRRRIFSDNLAELNKLSDLGHIDFPVAPIKAPLYHKDQKAFDKITYPLKTIIPNPEDWGGVKEAVFKTYKGRKNCMRYYTKRDDLTDKQCELLFADDDLRAVYGYEINGKQGMTSRMFGTFIRWLSINQDNLEEEDIIEDVEFKAYKELSSPVRTNPDGSRKPLVISMGVNSYMARNKLTNPTQIIEAHTKKEKLKIYDFTNFGDVCGELNITAQEAMDYVSAYLTKNRNLRRKHTEDRELARGATALKILIDFYKAEVKRTTNLKLEKPKTKIFGYKELMGSQQYIDYCNKTGEPRLRQYESFKKWIRKRLNALAKIK